MDQENLIIVVSKLCGLKKGKAMSSIGQSIIMAVAVTVNKYNSSNVQAVNRKQPRKPSDVGRRGLLLSSVAAAISPQLSDSAKALLEKYLKKSEENKAKNDKERLESYYKRNYKDYFEFVEGSIRAKSGELSESEKGILEWLQRNK